ncbi:hypothetical protein ACN9MJ_12995 [Acidovorax facilis]|uniref:hypothetical protein n=1 Tax=Acidovorax facilis TaxID=12917 RepID=UPI003CF24A4A
MNVGLSPYFIEHAISSNQAPRNPTGNDVGWAREMERMQLKDWFPPQTFEVNTARLTPSNTLPSRPGTAARSADPLSVEHQISTLAPNQLDGLKAYGSLPKTAALPSQDQRQSPGLAPHAATANTWSEEAIGEATYQRADVAQLAVPTLLNAQHGDRAWLMPSSPSIPKETTGGVAPLQRTPSHQQGGNAALASETALASSVTMNSAPTLEGDTQEAARPLSTASDVVPKRATAASTVMPTSSDEELPWRIHVERGIEGHTAWIALKQSSAEWQAPLPAIVQELQRALHSQGKVLESVFCNGQQIWTARGHEDAGAEGSWSEAVTPRYSKSSSVTHV